MSVQLQIVNSKTILLTVGVIYKIKMIYNLEYPPSALTHNLSYLMSLEPAKKYQLKV